MLNKMTYIKAIAVKILIPILAIMALITSTLSAQALSGSELLEQFKSNSAYFLKNLKYEASNTSTENGFVISNVTFDLNNSALFPAGQGPAQLLIKGKAARIEVKDAINKNGNLLVIGEVSAIDASLDINGIVISLANFNGQNMPLNQATVENLDEYLDLPYIYNMFDINVMAGPMKLTSIQSIKAQNTIDQENNKLNFIGKITQLFLDPALLPDIKTQNMIKQLGYTTFNLDMDFIGNWDAQSGDMNITQYNFNVKDVGTLGFNFSLAGITKIFYSKLLAMLEKIQQTPEAMKDITQLEPLMEEYSKLMLVNASVKFTDDSVTNRVLELNEKTTGMSRKQLIQGVSMMAQFTIPPALGDFGQQLNTAIGTFLNAPNSIEIKTNIVEPIQLQKFEVLKQGTPIDEIFEFVKTLHPSAMANQ